MNGDVIWAEAMRVSLADQGLKVAAGSIDVCKLPVQGGLRKLESVDDGARSDRSGANCSIGNGEEPVWLVFYRLGVVCFRDVVATFLENRHGSPGEGRPVCAGWIEGVGQLGELVRLQHFGDQSCNRAAL